MRFNGDDRDNNRDRPDVQSKPSRKLLSEVIKSLRWVLNERKKEVSD